MRRPPLLATAIVGLAVAAMISLGVWQLRRAEWKDALIARYAANASAPPIAFPRFFPPDGSELYRRSSVMCLEPASWSVASGRSRSGASGWRHLARCRTGAEGPGATVDMGWSPDFQTRPAWKGGSVTGMIGSAPDHRSLIATLLGRGPAPGVLLVADRSAPGLQPSAYPSLDEVPNNHRAYAVQWFLFAAMAVLIYALALRRRGRPSGPA